MSGAEPELVQTHASYVLLTDDRAYKLKKPLDFGFLDYTTLERRRAACEAEVALNRRLTHGVYLGVQPVVRTATGFQLGDEGELVDYAVVMRRLPAERMMDRLVAEGRLAHGDLARLAERLATFYESAAHGPAIDDAASPAALLANWQENLAQTLPFVGRTIAPGRYAQIAAAVYRELVRLRPLWRERVESGRSRDGHGDLRPSAVCFEDEIQVYDCIEFNERFRYGDVAADIAFLTMDLDSRGETGLADEFLVAFVAASADPTLTAVFPFYRCYRAYVRAKVDSFQLDEAEVPARQREAERRRARYLFRLAAWYARPHPARTFVIDGGDHETRAAVATVVAGRVGGVLLTSADEGVAAQVHTRRRDRISSVLAVDAGERLPDGLTAALQTAGTVQVVIGDERGVGPAAIQVQDGEPMAVARAVRRWLGLEPPRPPSAVAWI